MSRKKRSNHTTERGHPNSAVSFLLSNDAYDMLCVSGYTRLADSPEIQMAAGCIADLMGSTQEDEIIAPYSTVKRAATQGILESGVLNSQRGPKTAVMALDGRTFARLETPYILEEFNRIGVKFQK